ncbi:MAG: nitroreductase family protein [Oscillospiraceae bacterium]|nr:nitroreductase family protein [Oscillospiraceae bacterium]
MNEVIQQLHDRKSVRVYEDRPIEPEVKQAILEAAIQAPSAGNMALYTILDITDPELKRKLSVSCDNQPFIATAPMVLIFCADYRRWYDVFCAHVDGVRKPGMGDLFLAQADALIAAQNAVVAAHSLGIGSCYIGDITENFEYHKELLGLPQYVVPAAMLCFGYPTQQQRCRPKPPRHAVSDLVHENGYSLEKSAQMERMLSAQQGKEGEELADWIRRFCKRKWNSDFSREMSRSCTEMVSAWCDET